MATTTHLPDRYVDAEQIGHGGMGRIYRATDSVLGREVAIKVLDERFADDPTARRRFEREARAAASLSERSDVVTVFDVGEHAGQPLIVMEYLPGGTVEDRVAAADGAVDEAWALDVLETTAAALDAAHARGVVHRDVKPANLLLDEAGRVHVGDFGIARVLDQATSGLTLAGTMVGTSGYLSPEQALGEEVGPASDRYSLAVLAFQLLTGRRPFHRESAAGEAAAHAHEEPPAPSDIAPDLSAAVDAVLARGLAKDPDERPSSCAELVRELRAALHEPAMSVAPIATAAQPTLVMSRAAGAARTAPPARAGTVAPRRSRPWGPRAAALGAAALVVLAAGVAIAQSDDGPTRTGMQTPAPEAPDTTAPPATTEEPAVTAQEPAPAPEPQPDPQPEPAPDPGLSRAEATARNDEAFRLMQRDRYADALPLLQAAVPALEGAGITEAYANYNLGATLAALGRCPEALPYIDRSEALQGPRREFDQVRTACTSGGEDKGKDKGKGKDDDD